MRDRYYKHRTLIGIRRKKAFDILGTIYVTNESIRISNDSSREIKEIISNLINKNTVSIGITNEARNKFVRKLPYVEFNRRNNRLTQRNLNCRPITINFDSLIEQLNKNGYEIINLKLKYNTYAKIYGIILPKPNFPDDE